MISITFEYDADVESNLDRTPENVERLRWALIRAMEWRPLEDEDGVVIGRVCGTAARDDEEPPDAAS